MKCLFTKEKVHWRAIQNHADKDADRKMHYFFIYKKYFQPGVVAHTRNPSYSGARDRIKV
jgi:hypothetical protein